MFQWLGVKLFVFQVVLITGATWATPLAAPADHPARVTTVEGRAMVYEPGQSVGTSLLMNYSIWSGERLVLGEDARLELEFHEGSRLRLGPGTELVVAMVGKRRTQLHLISGSSMLVTQSAGRYELYAESTYLYPDGAGCFYLAREAGVEMARVLEGRVRTVSEGRAWNLFSGENLLEGKRVSGFPLETQSLVLLMGWPSRHRDESPARTWSQDGRSLPYGGVVELGFYGSWGRLASHGQVWWPDVKPNWDPYGNGQWRYHGRQGRTWLSHEPWGWLPYHYGAWFFAPQYSRWCWVPGDLQVWSPGRVRFPRPRNFWGTKGRGITVSADPGIRERKTRNSGWTARGPRSVRPSEVDTVPSVRPGQGGRPLRLKHPGAPSRSSPDRFRSSPRLHPSRGRPASTLRAPVTRGKTPAARVISRIGSVARAQRR